MLGKVYEQYTTLKSKIASTDGKIKELAARSTTLAEERSTVEVEIEELQQQEQKHQKAETESVYLDRLISQDR